MKKILMVSIFLLAVIKANAESAISTKEGSRDSCIVLAIINMDSAERLQTNYEDPFLSKNIIVGTSLGKEKIELFFLDDSYDFDLYSLQKGDTIMLHYPSKNHGKQKKAVAIENPNYLKKVQNYGDQYIDLDIWDIDKKLSTPPVLDDGSFLKWDVAKRRFIKHLMEDKQGYHTLDVEDESKLSLSKRLFGQLYNIYVSGHNETIRSKKQKD